MGVHRGCPGKHSSSRITSETRCIPHSALHSAQTLHIPAPTCFPKSPSYYAQLVSPPPRPSFLQSLPQPGARAVCVPGLLGRSCVGALQRRLLFPFTVNTIKTHTPLPSGSANFQVVCGVNAALWLFRSVLLNAVPWGTGLRPAGRK